MRRWMIVVLLCSCWLLIGCGGSNTTGAIPSEGAASAAASVAASAQPEPDDPQPTAVPVEPVVRAAECAFPERMRVGQPAMVRFSIFSADNQPNALPSVTTAVEPLVVPSRPELTTWVAVSLNANGAPVAQDVSRQFQQLSQRSNIWIWQVTPSDTQPIVLQPIVDVEFRDASGQVIERQANIWTQTYTVPQVVGSGYLSVAGAWLGDSVQELIVGFIGAALLRVGSGGRQLIAQRFGKKDEPLDGSASPESPLSPARPDDQRD